MKFNFFISVFTIACIVASCSSSSTDVEKAFSQEPNWQELSATWNQTKGRKVLVKNGQLDTIDIDTIHWQEELLKLTDLGWNTQASAANYSIDSATLSLVKKTRYTFKANSDKQLVQLAEFTYSNNQLTEATYVVKEENPVYDFERVIHIIPNEKIEVRVNQEVTQLMNEAFTVTTEVLPVKTEYTGYLHREDGVKLPIRFFTKNKSFVFVNGAEQIEVIPQKLSDSILLEMPVFSTEFHLAKTANGFEGFWYNNDGSGYKLPFSASLSEQTTANLSSYIPALSGEWKTTFIRPNKTSNALAVFEQSSHELFGTFMTQSGDYRSLQGSWQKDSFYLSTFDGSHAYLFTGIIQNEKITGHWYSGKSFHITWEAEKDASFVLPQADTLTYLKDGYETIDFSFPDVNGNLVSLSDNRYKGKPVIVTIMGSWCPNCMDEARYFKKIYPKYHEKGLEIIGLSFERTGEFEKDLPAIHKAIKDLEIEYTVLHAGKAGGVNAAAALPMLNHVISFPTSIYINREGKVVKIHTGFTGPGTGERYEEFTTENAILLDKFLR